MRPIRWRFFVFAKKFYLADSEKLVQECLYQAGNRIPGIRLTTERHRMHRGVCIMQLSIEKFDQATSSPALHVAEESGRVATSLNKARKHYHHADTPLRIGGEIL